LSLSFVHLSDIHFQRKSGKDHYDLDADLRNELEQDLSQLNKDFPIKGILITGDIAFSGHAEEFKTAESWLAKLCDLVGCDQSSVWCVPGNHDVDRSIVQSSDALQTYHRELRQTALAELDDRIAKVLRDSAMGPLLLAPLQNYNRFATKFQCAVDHQCLWWEDDFEMNDGSILRFRGLNSVLVSDTKDDDGQNRLVLGSFQPAANRQEGVEYLTLCHHPPTWFFDADEAERCFKARIRIQLFGHKHRHTVDRINDSLRITAGATHPDRREPKWIPRYNLISFTVKEDQTRKLSVCVLPRKWNDDKKKFQADHEEGQGDKCEYDLPIPKWRSRPVAARAEKRAVHENKELKTVEAGQGRSVSVQVNPAPSLHTDS
jgi:hypothetical protein